MLTQSELKSILHYDTHTGIFTRRKSTYKLGNKVGTKAKDGYIQASILGKLHRMHRLAWLYVYGSFPEKHIDHINRIRDDNRIENLREVSQKKNLQNRITPSNSTTGRIGVSVMKGSSKYRSTIYVNGKSINLGVFDILSDAINAREHAERIYKYRE